MQIGYNLKAPVTQQQHSPAAAGRHSQAKKVEVKDNKKK
jgi:hypothetical protein